jgi:hypothetical protein
MIHRSLKAIAVTLPLSCVTLAHVQAGTESALEIVSATLDPVYDSLFEPRKRGWLGADGAVSIPLTEEKTVWIFGDTILGTMNDQGARKGPMVRNTIAIHDRSGKGPGTVEFYWDLTDKITGDFFYPEDFGADFWYWPGAGAMLEGELFLFLYKITSGEGEPGFDFELADMTLCRVSNPLDPPKQWKKSYEDLGLNGPHRGFSSALLVNEPYVYLLGYDDGPEGSYTERAAVLARVKIDRLKDGKAKSAFEYWTEGKEGPDWSDRCENLVRLFEPGTTESSLQYLPDKKLYLAVTHRAFQDKMYVVTAPEITGPWSEPVEVYTIPEMATDENLHAYAMKSHPELAKASKELVITYVVNTKDFWSVFSDNSVYYPRFVRVKYR